MMTPPTQVQDDELPPPVAARWIPSEVWRDYVYSDSPDNMALACSCGVAVEYLYTADQFRTALAASRAADEALMRDVLETIERSCDPCVLPANGHDELKLTARALRARLEGTKT